MSVETLPSEPTVSALSVQGSNYTSQISLGPPFFAPWGTYTLPEPQGFNCHSYFSPHNGGLWAEMWAEPHPPTAPLTIGWCSLGYKQLRLRLRSPGFFFALIRPTKIQVVHNGGVWVPKGAISLHQGRTLIDEDIRTLYLGSTAFVQVDAPRAGDYDLSVGAAIRSVYKGTGNPYGMLDAQIQGVFFVPRFQAETLPEEEGAAISKSASSPVLLPVHEDADERSSFFASLADAELQEIGTVESMRAQRDR